jgi:hypothetical protein
MVDALRRASQWLKMPRGRIIDVHPTAAPARLAIVTATETTVVGEVADRTEGYGPCGRHAHADAAVALAIGHGELVLEQRRAVTFVHHADTLDEMRAHVSAEWHDAAFPDDTLRRAESLIRNNPGSRIVLEEDITLSRLCPARHSFRWR